MMMSRSTYDTEMLEHRSGPKNRGHLRIAPEEFENTAFEVNPLDVSHHHPDWLMFTNLNAHEIPGIQKIGLETILRHTRDKQKKEPFPLRFMRVVTAASVLLLCVCFSRQ